MAVNSNERARLLWTRLERVLESHVEDAGNIVDVLRMVVRAEIEVALEGHAPSVVAASEPPQFLSQALNEGDGTYRS